MDRISFYQFGLTDSSHKDWLLFNGFRIAVELRSCQKIISFQFNFHETLDKWSYRKKKKEEKDTNFSFESPLIVKLNYSFEKRKKRKDPL